MEYGIYTLFEQTGMRKIKYNLLFSQMPNLKIVLPVIIDITSNVCTFTHFLRNTLYISFLIASFLNIFMSYGNLELNLFQALIKLL